MLQNSGHATAASSLRTPIDTVEREKHTSQTFLPPTDALTNSNSFDACVKVNVRKNKMAPWNEALS